MGASRVLLMDEISTGLDSSTTHQIIRYLRHSTRALEGTTVISLLQPDPETYELFDDVILLSEGQIVYQGPREGALEFFTYMGFRCPERKNVADFLQEVCNMYINLERSPSSICKLHSFRLKWPFAAYLTGNISKRSKTVLVPWLFIPIHPRGKFCRSF